MTEDLTQHLAHAVVPTPHDAKLCVAFSGGADSTALLHALAHLPQARERPRAVHVDHGLHPDSAQWARHCEKFCAMLDVSLELLHARVDNDRGEGLEAAARRARYAAFAQTLRDGETLVLAHHRDDQVETVLLKLLRGAGPEGLGGMREQRAFANGTLWRPLLDLSRPVLLDYVAAHGLPYINDPSNRDTRLSRNFLRAEILPRLSAHWPQAADSIAHSASLCRAAAEELDRVGAASLAMIRDDDGMLDARAWSTLSDGLRAPVLERWLRERGLPAPNYAQCTELRRQIDHAQTDRVPCVAWAGATVHVWRGSLHASLPVESLLPDWHARWNGAPLCLPAKIGVLALHDTATDTTAQGAAFDPTLQIRFRRGGEHIKPDGNPHTRELRDLLQQASIPPWQRDRIPLIFHGDELIAVGDLWISAAGKSLLDARGVRIKWLKPGCTIDSRHPLR